MSKLGVLGGILQPEVYPEVYPDLYGDIDHVVRISATQPAATTRRGGTFAHRAGADGVQEWLSFFLKAPQAAGDHQPSRTCSSSTRS